MSNLDSKKFNLFASVFIVAFALIFIFSIYQQDKVEGAVGGGGTCPQVCEWIECTFTSQQQCEDFIEECRDDDPDCQVGQYICELGAICEGKWDPVPPGGGGDGGEGGQTCAIRGWAWGASGPENGPENQ